MEIRKKISYKQVYRSSWEQLEEFKGWLCQVFGEPNRAYCRYCRKTLHAHRLSLLKHTATARHQNATIKFQESCNDTNEQKSFTPNIKSIRKKRYHILGERQFQVISSIQKINIPEDVINKTTIEENYENSSEIKPADENEQSQFLTMEENVEEMVEYNIFDQNIDLNDQSLPPPTHKTNSEMASQKPPISTHILDTSIGVPAKGVLTILFKFVDNDWEIVNKGETDADGRVANFLKHDSFSTGRYKLKFCVEQYFMSKNIESLYPFVEIVFDVKSVDQHYHIPLLLNPFGYTTYRGS